MVGLGRGTNIRGQTPDFHLEIAEKDIQPEDVEMLTRELNLKETTPTTLDALRYSRGDNWFHEFKNMDVGTFIEERRRQAHPGAGQCGGLGQ